MGMSSTYRARQGQRRLHVGEPAKEKRDVVVVNMSLLRSGPISALIGEQIVVSDPQTVGV